MNMKLPLDDSSCKKLLNLEWDKYEKEQAFTQEQILGVAFWGDVSNDDSYIWRAYIPHLNQSISMTVNRKDKSITTNEYNGREWDVY